MKTRVSNLVKYFKKLSAKKEITSASVSFQSAQIVGVVTPKSLATDFLDEFKEAIRSGDDTLWRMWR
jgi:predicted DNA-binding ribbon-helix-helix protein